MPNHATATLAADLVLFNGYNEVLLARRANDPFAGRWALPGGRVDEGETFLAAAVREAAEETGLDLTNVKLVEVGTYGTPGRDPRGRVVSVAYAAKGSFPAAVAGSDAAELAWVDPDDALEQGLAFDHATILADALGLLYDHALDTPTSTFHFENHFNGNVGRHIQAHTINNLELG
jgi:8-oxo-dGTP diphosphatase